MKIDRHVGPSTPFARLEKLIFLVFLGWSRIHYIYIYIYIYIFPLVSRSGFESSTASVDLIASAHTDWTVLDSIVRLDSARFGSLRGIRSGNSFSDWSLHIRSDNTGCQSLADFHTCIPPLLFARIGVDDRILGCSNALLYSC